MASGIRDKVVILGMGCSRFGERWDCDAEDLMVEAFEEAMGDAGVERDRIDAAWLGVFYQEQSTSKSGLPLSMAPRLPNTPVTRVENLCATGTEALRGSCGRSRRGRHRSRHGRREAQGHRFSGCPTHQGTFDDLWYPGFTPPAPSRSSAPRTPRATASRWTT
jgi:acetyl-CoA C-acetyltransferase